MSSVFIERIAALRALMKQNHLDYYYIPSIDAHADEYVPTCWQRRAWISGFTGSNGDVLVGMDQALLWTDSRYFLQAESELDGDVFQLMKLKQGQAADVAGWLIEQAAPMQVGVDPRVMMAEKAEDWLQRFSTQRIDLVGLDENLVDQIWDDQPGIPFHDISLHSLAYAGVSAADKIADVRWAMKEKGVDAHVITALDAIAWLCNIRGSDIAYHPLAISYVVMTHDNLILFLGVDDLSEKQRVYFESLDITIDAYENFALQLHALSGTVLLDGLKANWWLVQQLAHNDLVLDVSPIDMMKAKKNVVEQAGAQEAHVRDAVSMVRFWRWLESHWQGQTEHTVAAQLDQIRLSDPHCHELSFPTISGYADHGAIIHYRHDPEACHAITGEGLLLVDSGGQYDFGTTDITRVFHFSTPTPQQCLHYTLVLQGHLAFRQSVFPFGKQVREVEQVARWPLWRHGLDFGHGVSHGVGSYLCVHEGVHTSVGGAVNVALEPGMTVSNEPGLYLPGEYGIRIENCVLVSEVYDAQSTLMGHGPFYGFQDLTLVPYNKALIDTTLLSSQEVAWIDAYHQRVQETLRDRLTEDECVWLSEKTSPLMGV